MIFTKAAKDKAKEGNKEGSGISCPPWIEMTVI